MGFFVNQMIVNALRVQSWILANTYAREDWKVSIITLLDTKNHYPVYKNLGDFYLLIRENRIIADIKIDIRNS